MSCNSDSSLNNRKNRSVNKMLEIRADYLFDNDRFKELVPIFDSLILLDSLNGKFYFQRAYSYSMLFNQSSAISDYLLAAKMTYRVSDSYYNAGINSMFSNDSLALYYFRRALENDPENKKAKFELEECKTRLNNKLLQL